VYAEGIDILGMTILATAEVYKDLEVTAGLARL
jgi:hypothetical protein